jgi:glutaredoxin 2
MAWCGAEAIFSLKSRENYDRVTAALDKIAKGRVRERELPQGYTNVADLYFIDTKDRSAFDEIMSRND